MSSHQSVMNVVFSEIMIDASESDHVLVQGAFHVHKWHATFNEIVKMGQHEVWESSVSSLVQRAWRQHLRRNAEEG